jgi:glycosyltransferase involved in cell wall biosynthesis
MVKRVLMIAFHFPPLRGSSGIQRTLKFSQYLPQFHWKPVVLTAHPRAYTSTSNEQLADISAEVTVRRAFAVDTARHLAIKGYYPGILSLPDRWISWWLGAVPAGLRLIRQFRPEIIWSTYPIATAHLIGLSLHRLTGIPWIADLRDPMTDIDYPPNRITRWIYSWIERKTITHCTRAVCTTPGAIKLYRERFPDIPASRFCLIENAYDEENFTQATANTVNTVAKDKPFVLLHSGIIYPSERDPTQLFQALAALSQRGCISAANFRLVLRATANDKRLAKMISDYGIESLVSLEPPIPYRDALAEMLAADGLLILQASNCNNQIPAKLYEYLRAQRPVLGLADPAGDTAGALMKAGIDTIAPLDSTDQIMEVLIRFLDLARRNEAPVPTMENVRANSRQSRSGELAHLFDTVVAEADVMPEVAESSCKETL